MTSLSSSITIKPTSINLNVLNPLPITFIVSIENSTPDYKLVKIKYKATDCIYRIKPNLAHLSPKTTLDIKITLEKTSPGLELHSETLHKFLFSSLSTPEDTYDGDLKEWFADLSNHSKPTTNKFKVTFQTTSSNSVGSSQATTHNALSPKSSNDSKSNQEEVSPIITPLEIPAKQVQTPLPTVPKITAPTTKIQSPTTKTKSSSSQPPTNNASNSKVSKFSNSNPPNSFTKKPTQIQIGPQPSFKPFNQTSQALHIEPAAGARFSLLVLILTALLFFFMGYSFAKQNCFPIPPHIADKL